MLGCYIPHEIWAERFSSRFCSSLPAELSCYTFYLDGHRNMKIHWITDEIEEQFITGGNLCISISKFKAACCTVHLFPIIIQWMVWRKNIFSKSILFCPMLLLSNWKFKIYELKNDFKTRVAVRFLFKLSRIHFIREEKSRNLSSLQLQTKERTISGLLAHNHFIRKWKCNSRIENLK